MKENKHVTLASKNYESQKTCKENTEVNLIQMTGGITHHDDICVDFHSPCKESLCANDSLSLIHTNT